MANHENRPGGTVGPVYRCGRTPDYVHFLLLLARRPTRLMTDSSPSFSRESVRSNTRNLLVDGTPKMQNDTDQMMYCIVTTVRLR